MINLRSATLAIVALGIGVVTSSAPRSTLSPGPGWCAGTDIVLLLPGDRDDLNTAVVFEGAVTAAADLGAAIPYTRWGNWDTKAMADQLRAAVELRPDAIIVSGYAGDLALAAGIDAAEAVGIRVTSFGPSLPIAQSKWKARGFGNVGADIYQAGYDLARDAVIRSKVKLTDKVFVWGQLDTAALADRTRGILDALSDAGLTAVIYKDIGAVKSNLSFAPADFAGTMAANPGIKLVITDHGALSGWHEQILTASSTSNTAVYTAGVDLSYSTAKALRSGYTDLVIDDLSYYQGYAAVVQSCMSTRYNVPGVRIDLATHFVDIANVDQAVIMDDYQPWIIPAQLGVSSK